MALHHPQPRAAASFTFPSSARPSSARDHQPSTLAAAFDYPVRADSLAHHATHAPQASTSSTASDSSRGYSTTRSAVSSTYTAFTSDSYDHDDACACDDDYSDAGSVLDDLYRDFASSPPSRPATRESPPRFHQPSASTDSTMQLRERTRYRSSASLMPAAVGGAPHHLAGAFGSLSIASTTSSSAQAAPDSHMALLAALAATSSTLDRCFCGAEPEEDSIYCSRACAQADALNALCGTSSGAEDAASSSDAASLRSGSSGGSGGIDSHYRRVEREETRRAKERERALRREEKERKARAAERERAEADDARRAPGSLWRSEGDVCTARRPSQERVAPPPRTSSRRTPSLSSSASSLPSSAAPSPISPSFPHHAGYPPSSSVPDTFSPFIVEPPTPASLSFPSHSHALNIVAEEPSLAPRPCTPNPKLLPAAHGALDAGDIYSSYLLATPQAGDKLRTPTQHPSDGSADASHSTPRAAFPHTPGGADDDDDESPTQRGAGAAGIGLRMLEMCGSDDEGDDEVPPLRAGGHRRAAPLGSGHTKGKLSFDDVVGILSG
ncbi:hypothetical protein JCM3770_006381 [Rhodotorula araucariae]